jgi:hypothetical protein
VSECKLCQQLCAQPSPHVATAQCTSLAIHSRCCQATIDLSSLHHSTQRMSTCLAISAQQGSRGFHFTGAIPWPFLVTRTRRALSSTLSLVSSLKRDVKSTLQTSCINGFQGCMMGSLLSFQLRMLGVQVKMRTGPADVGATGPVYLMPPEDFLPFMVPFKGGPGPLCGGACSETFQWSVDSDSYASLIKVSRCTRCIASPTTCIF